MLVLDFPVILPHKNLDSMSSIVQADLSCRYLCWIASDDGLHLRSGDLLCRRRGRRYNTLLLCRGHLLCKLC